MLIYKKLCPICNWDITDQELLNKWICKECDKKWLKLNLDYNIENYIEYFKNNFWYYPNDLQIFWYKRFFLRNSFSIIAPTWIWKTTFMLSIAWLVDKVLYVLPTWLLAKHIFNRFISNKKAILYDSKISKLKKEEIKNDIKNGNFNVLFITSAFLTKNFELIKNIKFDLILVDDVDSILKSYKTAKKLIDLISNDTILITWSATVTPKTWVVKLLYDKLKFEVGKINYNIRNIIDLYYDWDLNFEDFSILKKYLDIFWDWILLFLSDSKFLNTAEDQLSKMWISVSTYQNFKIEDFISKKIRVLIWIANYKNSLVRWLDLPKSIKFVIFWWVPKFIFHANIKDSPKALLTVILNLERILPLNLKNEIGFNKFFINSVRYLKNISYYTSKIDEIYDNVKSIISNPLVNNILKERDDVFFDWENFIVADVATYIQASWRVSRLYKWWFTKWLSLVFVDNKKAFNNLQKRLKLFYDDIYFEKLEDDFRLK